MLSVIKTFAADRPLFVCLAHLLLLLALAPRGGQGSSLREHRLRGSEADPAGEHLTPNADMLKALQYIESLHQRSSAQQRPAFPARTGEAEKLRAVLRLASQPVQSKEEDGGEEKEDKSEELLQAVLSTLQQTEKAPKPPSLRPGAAEEPRDGAYPRAQQKPPGIRPHQKLPLMFEDEEEGERDEEDEGPDLEQESPFKRTNENVEEKYTPQNLATLQSVFDELDKLTGSKTPHKRHDEEEEEEEEDEEEDGDLFDLRDAAYDSAGGEAAEWGPLAEKEEEEGEGEEGEEDKQEVSRGLDYINDDEEDNEEDEEEEDGESFPVKRSDDPDDVANMVDYYLLKVLEKTEEEQKRELEEEEEELERAERRAAQTAYRDGIDPRAVYQLIRISQKYQIPAENLLELLKMAEITNQNKFGKSSKPSRAQSRLSQMFSRRKPKIPEAESHSRRFRDRQKTPEEQRTEEVLNILGLGGSGGDRKEQQHRSSLARLRSRPAVGRWGGPAPTQQRRPASPKANYDDSVDEDELAAYLATQMLAQYPKPGQRQNKAGQKREEGRGRADPLEQALQDYLDQMDSDKSPSEKRQSEDEERGEEAFDSGELMKLLSFLNPEDEESDAAAAKTEDGV